MATMSGLLNMGQRMEIRLQIDDDYCQGNGSCLETDEDEVYEDDRVKRTGKPKSIKVGRAKNKTNCPRTTE